MAAPWTEADLPDLTGRRALVTGAASGIGLETARALARRGAEVLLVDRDEVGGRAAAQGLAGLGPGPAPRFLALDLGRQRAVEAFAGPLLAEGRPLHLLVNCAGIQPLNHRLTTEDGFELTFGIGHLGHFALTGRLLPLLLAAPGSRVVTVSSMVHAQGHLDWDDLQVTRGYHAQRAYNQTKLANLLFALELHRRLAAAGRPVASLAAHPGIARTSLGAHRHRLGRFGPLDHLTSGILALVMPLLGQPAGAGALPTLYAAASPAARSGGFYGPRGFGEMTGPPGPATVRRAGQDPEGAQRLWRVSEELTGVRYPG